MSDCGLTAECLKDVMEALFNNTKLDPLYLDISYNSVGLKAGALFSETLKKAKTLRYLNLGHMGLKNKGSLQIK